MPPSTARQRHTRRRRGSAARAQSAQGACGCRGAGPGGHAGMTCVSAYNSHAGSAAGLAVTIHSAVHGKRKRSRSPRPHPPPPRAPQTPNPLPLCPRPQGRQAASHAPHSAKSAAACTRAPRHTRKPKVADLQAGRQAGRCSASDVAWRCDTGQAEPAWCSRLPGRSGSRLRLRVAGPGGAWQACVVPSSGAARAVRSVGREGAGGSGGCLCVWGWEVGDGG